MKNVAWKNSIKFIGGFISALIICNAAFAQTVVNVKAKYAAHQNIGCYYKGKFNKSIGFPGRGPVYPVHFDQAKVESGTISFWFKPTRQIFASFAGRNLLTFSDGMQTLLVHNIPKKTSHSRKYSLLASIFSGYSATGPPSKSMPKFKWHVWGKAMDDKFADRFHHFLYTWDKKQLDIYLDGKNVSSRQRGKNGKWLKAFDGTKITLRASGMCSWTDELIVLKHRVEEKEVKSLYKATAPWKINVDTALYVPFDNNVAGKSVLGKGDLINFSVYLGTPDGMFRACDKPKMTVSVKNTSLKSGKAQLNVLVKDFKRNEIMKKSISIRIKPQKVTNVVVDFSSMNRKGPFYAYLELKKDGQVLQKEKVPFAITLGVDITKYASKDIYSGLVSSNIYNPPVFEKWNRLTYESRWRNIELEPGKWYWNRLDMMVNEKLATGRIPVLILSTPPAWRKSSNPKYLYFNPADLKGWKDYVRRVATRYKGKIFNYLCVGEAYQKARVGAITAKEYSMAINAISEITRAVDPKINTICDIGGYDNWCITVAKLTAGKANYYAIHPYETVGGAGFHSALSDAEDLEVKLIKTLKRNKASTSLADTEVGCYTLMKYSVDVDGFPLSASEFKKQRIWEQMPKVFRERSRGAFVDWLTGSFRLVRLFVLDRAIGCRYTLW